MIRRSDIGSSQKHWMRIGRKAVLKMEAPYKASSLSILRLNRCVRFVRKREGIGADLVFTTDDIFEIRRWYSSSIDCASLA